MELTFTMAPWAIAEAVAFAIALVLIFGALGSWRVLGAKASPQLRGAS